MAEWSESGSTRSDSFCYVRNLRVTVIDPKQHNNVIKQDDKDTWINSGRLGKIRRFKKKQLLCIKSLRQLAVKLELFEASFNLLNNAPKLG